MNCGPPKAEIAAKAAMKKEIANNIVDSCLHVVWHDNVKAL